MNREPSLLQSFVIQKRVIGALLMREILGRYGRHNIGFLWLFIEPMMFTLAVTTLWSAINLKHGSYDISIVAFAVTGYSSVLLWRNMPGRLVLAVQPNHTLMHHRNVRLIDIYLSRLLLEAAGATTSFALLSTLWTCLGWMNWPVNPLEVFFGWFMMAWFGCSLALFVGALSERAEFVHNIWHPISYILFPLSGACFTVSELPARFHEFVLLIPMVDGVEIIREGYFGVHYHAFYSIAYMAAFNLILLLLGLTQVREVSRKVVA